MQRTASGSNGQAPIHGLDEQKYRGEWLVINGQTGRILIHDQDLRVAQTKAAKKGIEDPVFYRVPSTATHYVVFE